MFFFRSHGPQSLFKKQLARSGFLAFTNPLVAAQFGFSIVLIIWLFTVHSQTEFIMEADYGLNRKEVVLIDLPQVRTDHFRADLSYLIENIKAKAGVQDVAYFSNITGDAGNNKICLKRIETQDNTCAETNGGVSANFVAFFNIKLLAGRNFIQDLPSDSSVIIINRKASQVLGFKGPEDAVGRRILVNTGDWNNWKYREAEIIGVVENYHGNSSLLIDDVGSHGDTEMVLTYNDQLIPLIKPQKLAFRVGPNQFESTSRGLQKLYESVFPGQLFRFYFLDNQVAKYYVGEKTARNQILLITVIAIGIACLGLLGMISNKVVEKTKEIGIRKILGAALHQIASILLDTTTKQILVASLVGIPVAYYMTQQYLQKFSQRIELEWWHFALPVLILIIILLATVIAVVWKAAKSNPVEALKYE
jgi:putative ABC transport system permease protein